MEQTQKHSCLGEKVVWRPGTKQSKQPQRNPHLNGTSTENPRLYETTTKTSFSWSTYRSLLDTEIYELRYQPCHLCHTSEVGWYHVRIILWLVGYDDNSPGKSCPEANGHWTHLDAFYLHTVCAIPLAIWHAALRDKIVVITMLLSTPPFTLWRCVVSRLFNRGQTKREKLRTRIEPAKDAFPRKKNLW